MLTRHLPLAVFVALAACKGGAGLGQFGEDEDTVCVEAGSDPVQESDTVVVGYDGVSVLVGDAMAQGDGVFVATLTWELTGEQTAVTFTGASQPGTAELVHYDPADPEIPVENCPDRLRFALDGTLVTDDGRLDEAFVTDAMSDGEGVYADARIVGLGGTVDPQALAPGPEPVEADQVDLGVRLRPGDPPFTGQVWPVRADIPGEDVTPLGTWPGEQEEEGAR